MVNPSFYQQLTSQSIAEGALTNETILKILSDPGIEMLPLLNSAYIVRRQYFGKTVKIHILDNAQSGNCTEDCSYCAQSGAAANEEIAYPLKSEEKILKEAQYAHSQGAFRHCIVFSGKTLSSKAVDRVCAVVKTIKQNYPMEICVSAGFLTEEKALKLRAAGVDRYNHNLNTSEAFYPQICSTHTYQERINTIRLAQQHGFTICSGVIIGMGESHTDLLYLIEEFAKIKPDSIPVNFFIPVTGHRIQSDRQLTPEYCLKILSLFRLAFPKTEIRIAGGREYHLRSLQPLCLYAVDSLFAKGYLTTGGDSMAVTQTMIHDCGFEIKSIEY